MSRAGKAVRGAVVALGVSSCAFILVVAAGEGVDTASLWAGVVAALAGVMAAVAAIWPLAAGSAPGSASSVQAAYAGTAAVISSPPPFELGLVLSEAASDLAIAVRRRTGSRLNEVTGPYSLPVRWVNADESLIDHWECIRGAKNGTPLDLAGDLEHMSETFRQVSSGRLVVLGRPGSGKSVLALQFV